MQVAEVKTNSSVSPAIQAKREPFFSKDGEGGFFSKSNEATSSFFSPATIQPKLTIGQPNDKYEVEAGAMADKAVQRINNPMAAPDASNTTSSTGGIIQTKCSGCEDEERLQKKEEPLINRISKVQRKPIFESEDSMSPGDLQTKTDGASSKTDTNIESQLNSGKGGGRPLSSEMKSSMGSAFGTDFSEVRIHDDNGAAQMSKELNAQAFTYGSDIYFNNGKYDTNSTSGKHLLAHELTHVVQQKGSIRRKMIQCNFAPQSLPTSNGVFDFDMTTQEGLLATPPPAGAKSGVRGNIRFDPATTAPYSNEIALIQIVKLTDSGTGGNVDSGSMVPGRNVKTTEDAASGVEGGFLTDVEHRRGTTDAAPGSDLSAQYMINQLGVRDRGEFGFKRSNDPADIKKATLFDFPGTTSTASNLDFEFETVAKGNDTMTIYGSLTWSFGIRAGDVVNEQVSAADGQSATFDEALELHRDFYVHEPVIFYFGFDRDTLQTDEIAKIDTFLDYLARFPDVQLSLTGFADRRGDPDYNLDLSLRRAQNVRQALIDKGIDQGSIEGILIGFGATEQHTSGDRGPNPGQGQDLEANRRGNRRVELTFGHTQSFLGP